MYALIQPDILKIEKLYWYSINEIDNISVGSIVRIILNGRKVRGFLNPETKKFEQIDT